MGWQDDPIDTPNSVGQVPSASPPSIGSDAQAVGQVPSASPPAWASDPIDGEPNHPQATHTFARTLGNAIGSAVNTVKEGSSRSMETLGDIGQVYPVIEAGLNAATGVLFGFPAYVGAGLGGLAGKYLLGNEADPKALAETMQQLFTYQPMTERGIRLSGNLMYPLRKLMEGSDFTGEKVTDFAVNHGASDTTAEWSGSITSSTLQMLPGVLLGEFGRKMGGQTITNNDFANTSKIIAGSEATPADVHSVETSLRATYDKTGIGPFTVMDEAMKSPSIKSELLNPSVDVPKPFDQFIEKPVTSETVTPGDGVPLLDISRGEPTISDGHTFSTEAQRALSTSNEPTLGVDSGVINLHAGINPAEAIAAVRDGYSPYVGVERTDIKSSPVGDAIQKVFAPASRGDIAEQQAGIMRANLGEEAHQREVAMTKLRDTAAEFDKMPVADNIKFIDDMERGTPITGQKQSAAATALRELLDTKRDQVQALGKGQLENFDENYFPHMWKDVDEAQSLFSRRPLSGSGAFLKQRTIPYMVDGLRWRTYDAEGDFIKSFDNEAEAKLAKPEDGRVGSPMKPITTNPVEMALLKAREMDKYIYGQKIFAEMKTAGLAKFVPFGDSSPIGWTKINDKVARVFQKNEGDGGGMILRGEYYAPDEAATLINNHLSPGLQGNGFYDIWHKTGMLMNSLQLGLSAFHVGFTTMDSIISKVALGVKQVSRGDVVTGVGNMAQGVNPAQPFINIYKGDRLLRAYLGKLNDPDLAPIVDAIVQAGGRVKMDDFYRNTAVNEFKQALRTGDNLQAVKSFLPTVLDRMGAPIFEELVPRQKLGVFFDMAKDWLETNPKATLEQKRAGLGKLWDSVDNRMGQLVYDNVFWNRALKDGLMATVRSVGWNLGTFREIGGGLLDIKDIGKNKGFTDRTAYIIALPLMAAVFGSLTHYLYTGQAPETIKDAFYPRTGRTRPDGSEDRVSLPTYMKDVFAYGEDAHNFAKYGSDPTQTLKNKAHPLISTVSQMLNNQDFFGAAIRNPSAPATQQIMQESAFILNQISPFSYRNYIQQAKMRNEEPTLLGYFESPSMIGITPAPSATTKDDAQNESMMVSKLHDPLVKKFREDIKAGGDIDKLIPEMLNAGLNRRDIRFIIKSSGDTVAPHRLKKFGILDDESNN